ncbi:MAG: hypothetical protein ACFCVK_19275 [Acidimicrobiales bacterium]
MDGARQHRRGGRATTVALCALAVALTTVLGACGGGDDELTPAEALDKLAGRSLSERERTERLAVADLLCGFDARVLLHIWDRLDPGQLEFQDWVFGEHCPERLNAYAGARPTIGTAPTTTVDRDATSDGTVDTTTPGQGGPGDVDADVLGSILADLDTAEPDPAEPETTEPDTTDTDTTDRGTTATTDGGVDEGAVRSGRGPPPR